MAPLQGTPEAIVRSVALEMGIDPDFAWAIARQESGGNPKAAGDYSASKGRNRSIGLFQLNEEGMGAGMSVAQREDPETNARVALTSIVETARAHPELRNRPGSLAAASQRPADPTKYASGVDYLLNSTLSGTGGASPSPAATGSLAPTPYGNEQTIAAAITKGGKVITHAGDAIFSFADGHRGIDISGKGGDPTFTPVAGTVVDPAKYGLSKGYGLAATLLTDDGNLVIFGHTRDGAEAAVGTRLNAGDRISTINPTSQKRPGEATESDHVHLEVRRNGVYANQVEPIAYLAAKPAAPPAGTGGTRTMADTTDYSAAAAVYDKQVADLTRRAADGRKAITDAQATITAAEARLTARKGLPGDEAAIEAARAVIKDMPDQIKSWEQEARASEAKAAIARQPTGSTISPEQRDQIVAQTAQYRAQTDKLRADAAAIQDPNSPERRALESEIAQRDAVTATDNALRQGKIDAQAAGVAQTQAQTGLIGAQRDAAIAGTAYTQAQTNELATLLPARLRQAMAAAGLNEFQIREGLAKLQPEIDQIAANTARIDAEAYRIRTMTPADRASAEANTAYTTARTKELETSLQPTLRKLAADTGLTEQQTARLIALAPHEVANAEAQVAQTRASTGLTEAQTARTLTQTAQDELNLAVSARKEAGFKVVKNLIDSGASPEAIMAAVMSNASDVNEFTNAYTAQVTQRYQEETARLARGNQLLDLQRTQETERANRAREVGEAGTLRVNQANSFLDATRNGIGPMRMTAQLAAGADLMGPEGLRQLATQGAVGGDVLNAVMSGYNAYQDKLKGIRGDQPPTERVTGAQLTSMPAPSFSPRFTPPGQNPNAIAGPNMATPNSPVAATPLPGTPGANAAAAAPAVPIFGSTVAGMTDEEARRLSVMSGGRRGGV